MPYFSKETGVAVIGGGGSLIATEAVNGALTGLAGINGWEKVGLKALLKAVEGYLLAAGSDKTRGDVSNGLRAGSIVVPATIVKDIADKLMEQKVGANMEGFFSTKGMGLKSGLHGQRVKVEQGQRGGQRVNVKTFQRSYYPGEVEKFVTSGSHQVGKFVVS